MQRSNFRSRPLLSIIVPWMGDDRLFEDTLASVLRNQPEQSEILVPHNDRFIDRHGLENEVIFCEVETDTANATGNSLQALFNAAFVIAQGEFINLIRPSVEVDESWSCRPLEILNGNSAIGSVSTPILNAKRPKCLLTCGVNHTLRMKRRLVGGKTKSSWQQLNRQVIGPSNWCAFYSRAALAKVRGADGMIGDRELGDSVWDLDVALALNSLGYCHQVAADFSVSSEIDLLATESELRGVDASRMLARYEDRLPHASPASRLFATIGEIAAGLISPSRATFLLSRLSARKHRSVDEKYAQLLASRRSSLKNNERHLPIPRAA